MISEEINDKRVVTFFHLVDNLDDRNITEFPIEQKVFYTNRVVALILVLSQPVGDVVVDDTGVVSQGKVGVLVLRARLLLWQ